MFLCKNYTEYQNYWKCKIIWIKNTDIFILFEMQCEKETCKIIYMGKNFKFYECRTGCFLYYDLSIFT